MTDEQILHAIDLEKGIIAFLTRSLSDTETVHAAAREDRIAALGVAEARSEALTIMLLQNPC